MLGASLVALVGVSRLYPWSNLWVLAVALCGGRLLGDVRRSRLSVVLVVLAALDVASFVSGAQSAPGPPALSAPSLLANFTVFWPGGHFREGILDLLVLTAVNRQWVAAGQRWWALLWNALVAMGPILVAAAAGWHHGVPLLLVIAMVWGGSLLGPRQSRRRPSVGSAES